MAEDKMLSVTEAHAAQKLVQRYLCDGVGDLPEDERRLLGRLLIEAQFTLESLPRGRENNRGRPCVMITRP